VTIAHASLNFDRTGLLEDLNVVLPIDRLDELAANGTIGSVASTHYSFMGAQGDEMSTIRLDSGPTVARALRQDRVDVVLLTPV
jgi:D-proline reductase (dithiol) PrdB